MTDIWEEQNRFEIWVKIEIAALEAMEQINIVPKGTSAKEQQGYGEQVVHSGKWCVLYPIRIVSYFTRNQMGGTPLAVRSRFDWQNPFVRMFWMVGTHLFFITVFRGSASWNAKSRFQVVLGGSPAALGGIKFSLGRSHYISYFAFK